VIYVYSPRYKPALKEPCKLTYLLIAILLGLVIGPILAMRPSPAQKRKMALRNKAISLGMTAHFSDMPTRAGRLGQQAEQGIAYRLRYRPANKAKISDWRLLNRASTGYDWEWDRNVGRPEMAGKELLQQAVRKLPEMIRAVDYRDGVLAAYWQELGTEADVETIFKVLSEVQSVLDNEVM
jgi:hypothetical protein